VGDALFSLSPEVLGGGMGGVSSGSPQIRGVQGKVLSVQSGRSRGGGEASSRGALIAAGCG